MHPAHTLFLVSCVVLACGGGCFESSCPPPAPAVQVQPAEQLEAKAPARDANGQPLVVIAEAAPETTK